MASKKKSYALDTNILLSSPDCLVLFKDHDVYIPFEVIEELDSKKNTPGNLGYTARQAIRNINAILYKDGKMQQSGVITDSNGNPGDGRLYALSPAGALLCEFYDIPPDSVPHPVQPVVKKAIEGLEEAIHLAGAISATRDDAVKVVAECKKDDQILLSVATITLIRALQKKRSKIVFVTKDLALRIKASIIGLPTEEFKQDRNVELSITTPRQSTVVVDDPQIIQDLYNTNGCVAKPHGLPLVENQRALLIDGMQKPSSALVKCVKVYNDLQVKLIPNKQSASGVEPSSAEQKLCLDALMDPKVLVMCIQGPSGSGKTLLSISAALEQTIGPKPIFNKILLCKPVVPVDNDIGFLPGSEKDKLMPLMHSFFDNLEHISKDQDGLKYYNALNTQNKIDILPTYSIRGRSITNTFIIVDECQNLTSHAMKTIVSRVGEGTKIVLLGDPTQIDTAKLDVNNNGLTYLSNRFDNEECHEFFTNCFLTQSKRGKVSGAANKYL